MIETIQWTTAGVVMIDQTRIPAEETYVTCRDYHQVADAIRTMVIRGAPAIGVAAAMGVAIGVAGADPANLDSQVDAICAELAGTRPTATMRSPRMATSPRNHGLPVPSTTVPLRMTRS